MSCLERCPQFVLIEREVSSVRPHRERGSTSEMLFLSLCQVYRVKARWKFQLKDGIMRVGGFEYVFHKANGEAEW